MKKKVRMYALDFETTVYSGQSHTEVWSSAGAEINGTDVFIHHGIDETLNYLRKMDLDIIGYYHNLKFDGSFWVDWLLRNGWKVSEGKKKADMSDHEFMAVISDLGQWYTLTLKADKHLIEFRDSLKLIPFTLKQAGKAFNTMHQKLAMEYNGFRYSGCAISDDEKAYILNDVYVLKECLEFMFSQGHDRLTIGACCLAEFKSSYDRKSYDYFFPDLTAIEIPEGVYGAKNADEYIRKSYRGGWCYAVPGKCNKLQGRGFTADVNSLYPSMMSSESGNYYPVGTPTFWAGNFIPEKAKTSNHYYFIRLKCSFYLKPKHLPFIQIKGSPFYRGNEALIDSRPTVNGRKYKKVISGDTVYTDVVTMTLTCTDFKLLNDHYNLHDLEILDGCYFWNEIGVFDEYIEKYRKIKEESKGAKRTLAKLFLNNLYGKMASSDDSSHQIPYMDSETNTVKFKIRDEHSRRAGFIAIGSAITSYARNFTIRSAQANYSDFCYADTDSIHCTGLPKNVKGIRVHPTAFCAWKLESTWDSAIFVRQKTYIEHVIEEDLEPIEHSYFNIKCAGMNQICKDKFNAELASGKSDLTDFKVGLKIDGRLIPVRIPGGIVLKETTFEIR